MNQFKDLKIITNRAGQIAVIFLVDPLSFIKSPYNKPLTEKFCISYRQYFFINDSTSLSEEDVKIFQDLFEESGLSKTNGCLPSKIFNVDTLRPIKPPFDKKPRHGQDGGVVGIATQP